MSFLKLEDVHHTYFSKTSATTVLANISLQIQEGEFVSFLGPSGCGKTTLLSIIANLIDATEGNILLENHPVKKKKDLIGYMLQQDYLFPWKTIEENVLLGLSLTNRLNDETKKKALSLLKEMGLYDIENRYPKQLSGGMRQRVALVRTLATEPKLLMLDEPFSALDYQTKLKLEDLVSNTLKTFGKTAILVTHDIGEAIAMSDRIFLFSANPGRIVNTFSIPETIKALSPFEARSHEDFQNMFQMIWEELDSLETSREHQNSSSTI